MAKLKKKPKKKEIKQDTLVTYSVMVSRFVAERFNQIAVGLVVIAALVAFFLYTSHARKSAALDAERLLSSAVETFRQGDLDTAEKSFTEIAEQYSRSRAGVVALYYKGECNLKTANFPEAYASYDAYLRKSKKFPMFRESATIGKALALEGQGNYRQAGSVLEKLLEEMDTSDPRYVSVAFRAAIFYSKAPDMQYKAKQLFEIVAKQGKGRMKAQAEVALDVLSGAG